MKLAILGFLASGAMLAAAGGIFAAKALADDPVSQPTVTVEGEPGEPGEPGEEGPKGSRGIPSRGRRAPWAILELRSSGLVVRRARRASAAGAGLEEIAGDTADGGLRGRRGRRGWSVQPGSQPSPSS